MSTRATYEFIDNSGSYTVYKHHDGYPSGGLQWIANALKYAWKLPRFEAAEFAAAFIAANKPLCGSDGGEVYLSRGREFHGDTKYHYIVQCTRNDIYVDIEKLCCKAGENAHEYGTLCDLLAKYSKQTLKKTYSLYIEYPIISEFSEIDHDLEEKLGKERVGSGAGFGCRDLEFEYSSLRSVKYAVNVAMSYLREWFNEDEININYVEQSLK